MSHSNPATPHSEERRLVGEALRLLGKRNLVLAIHDPSFPGFPAEDPGRGTPYSPAGAEFLAFARELGFTGIQFGPQGQTSAVNLSPYDGTVFARNVLSISLVHLAEEEPWGALVSRSTLEEIVRDRPAGSDRRVANGYVHAAKRRALREAFEAFQGRWAAARPSPQVQALAARLAAFRRQHSVWLERDALYEAVAGMHEGAAWMFWPLSGEGALDRDLWDPAPGFEAACERRRAELAARCAQSMDSFTFSQWLAHEQHGQLRALAAGLGLKLYGDLQIGFSVQDLWSYRGLFMRRYLMGAPPSRTNPEGQPWNYPVLDPLQYGTEENPGPVRRLMAARMNKMLAEFDGVRLDHPHGLICPWVYRKDDPWPLHAVQHGTRLFCSPNLPEHPELAPLAIARPEQLNRSGVARHADDWVTALEPDQVRRYSALFDEIVAAARRNGREIGDLLAEVLSTMPYPLGAVLARYGLGRFRVTQKAILSDPADVYRCENAHPPDWVMVGSHDTPPLWLLLERWQASGKLREQADYLGWRLCPNGGEARERLAVALAEDTCRLAQAKFADLFASPAENVAVFFTDLLGMTEIYNRPGVVSDENWTLRVPPDYRAVYLRKRAAGLALNLPAVLALALRARSADLPPEAAALAGRLEEAGGMRR